MVARSLTIAISFILVCAAGAARIRYSVNQSLWSSKTVMVMDHDFLNKTSTTIDEYTTLGFEQEWSRKVCSVKGNLENHTLLFKTSHVRFTYETQGRADGSKPQIEAISDPFKVGTRTGAEEMDEAIRDVEGVHKCLHSHQIETSFGAMVQVCRKGLPTLRAEGNPATFNIVGGKESKEAKGLLFPQVTMTHKIGNVPRIFAQGYPDVEMSTKGNKAQRTTLLKQSAACGHDLMQTHIKTMAEGDVGYDDLHGFLVLVCQDVLSVYDPTNDNQPRQYWQKDAFGLLPKTPLGAILPTLHEAGRKALAANRKAIFMDILARASVEPTFCLDIVYGAFDLDRPCIINLKKYIQIVLTEKRNVEDSLQRCIAETAAACKGELYTDSACRAWVGIWRTIIADGTSCPIFAQGLDVMTLRPAFEYRQLWGGHNGKHGNWLRGHIVNILNHASLGYDWASVLIK